MFVCDLNTTRLYKIYAKEKIVLKHIEYGIHSAASG